MATELRLHRSLYDGDAIGAVAERYAAVATISIDAGEHELTVRFDQVDPDVADVLVDHFGNMALHETIVRRNQAEATMSGGDSA